MFVEEARVGSELVHQNLVQVYDFCGFREQGYFLVMEWVEGCGLGALATACQPGPTPWDEMTFVVDVVHHALAMDPDQRHSSASDFADELFEVLDRSQRKYLKTRLGERVRAMRG